MTVRFSKLANTKQSNFNYYLLGIASHQFKFVYSSLNFKSFLPSDEKQNFCGQLKNIWGKCEGLHGFWQNHDLSIKLHGPLLLLSASILSREKHNQERFWCRLWPSLDISAEFLHICMHLQVLGSPGITPHLQRIVQFDIRHLCLPFCVVCWGWNRWCTGLDMSHETPPAEICYKVSWAHPNTCMQTHTCSSSPISTQPTHVHAAGIQQEVTKATRAPLTLTSSQ